MSTLSVPRPGRLPTSRPGRPRLLPRTWVPVLALAMIISSDYKLRLRPPNSSLSGHPDLQTLVEIGVYAVVGIFLVLQLGSPPSMRRMTPLLLAAWAWPAAMALSCLWAIYPTFALVRGVQLLLIAGLAHAITTHARREHLHLLAHTFVVVVIISIGLGLAFPFPNGGRKGFNWFYVHPVVAGTYLGLAVTILVGYLSRPRAARPAPSWPTWVYSAALVICSAGLVASRTRGAMGAAFVGATAAVMLSSGRARRIDIAVIAALIVTVVLLAYSPEIAHYLSRGENFQKLATFNGRTPLWSDAIQFFLKRPLIGFGLTASYGLFLDATGLGGGHNAVINVLTDGGLLGLTLWGALVVGVLVTIRRLWRFPSVRWDLPMLAAVMTFFLVNSVTYEGLGAAANLSSIWLYVTVGWLGVLIRHVQQEHRSGVAPETRATVSRRPGS